MNHTGIIANDTDSLRKYGLVQVPCCANGCQGNQQCLDGYMHVGFVGLFVGLIVITNVISIVATYLVIKRRTGARNSSKPKRSQNLGLNLDQSPPLDSSANQQNFSDAVVNNNALPGYYSPADSFSDADSTDENKRVNYAVSFKDNLEPDQEGEENRAFDELEDGNGYVTMDNVATIGDNFSTSANADEEYYISTESAKSKSILDLTKSSKNNEELYATSFEEENEKDKRVYENLPQPSTRPAKTPTIQPKPKRFR